MLSIVTKNVITFTRLPYSTCSGYEIYAVETISGSEVTHLVEKIDNIKVPNLIKEKKMLEYNSLQKWTLPKDVLALATDSIDVYINNVQTNTNHYTYSPSLRILTIHSKLTANDLIEIEYNVDRIKLEYSSTGTTKYKVMPIFNESHKIGQHTIL